MNKPLILIVEDDPPIRNLISVALETHDYRFLTASNGGGAIMEASSHNPYHNTHQSAYCSLCACTTSIRRSDGKRFRSRLSTLSSSVEQKKIEPAWSC